MTQEKIINQNAMITKVTVVIGILCPKDNGNFADVALKSQTLSRLGGMLSHATNSSLDSILKSIWSIPASRPLATNCCKNMEISCGMTLQKVIIIICSYLNNVDSLIPYNRDLSYILMIFKQMPLMKVRYLFNPSLCT